MNLDVLIKRKSLSGFTLIELLIVMAIIGVLATLVLTNYNSSRERANDARRKADLRNIQASLRAYYNDYNRFPCSNASYQILGCGTAATCSGVPPCTWGSPWAVGTVQYMTILPKDPLDVASDTVNDYRYSWISNDDYYLGACLENKSDSQTVPMSTYSFTNNGTWCTSGWVYVVRP